jgi:DNA-binding NtrC family response regulator
VPRQRDQEKLLIEAALARSQGKVADADGASAQLGIPASTLESKIRQLKIEKARYTRSSRSCARMSFGLSIDRPREGI